ncbi:Large subunit GTPase 1 [Aduncisulcus paluster]|uniref:Large subunit GTPase 1 n=1 Tax=Aduncisulcus paluster TaxID=2918883 RepID=A0ABQ5JTC8_9EUKA|nr:Large subunit GTPase 1 [Aduncisulcus paluster]
MGRVYRKDKNQKNRSGLGHAITRKHSRVREQRKMQVGHLHTVDRAGDSSIVKDSVTGLSDLDELVAQAELSHQKFEAHRERGDAVLVEGQSLRKIGATEEEKMAMYSKKHLLRIPRRPFWTKSMTAEEINIQEHRAFQVWRKSLAELESDARLVFTPFEKNPEIWRQLWRVVERSDVIIQIVDARNPLLFFSNDLTRYVKEIAYRQKQGKESLLIINKADLIPEFLRKLWAKYFLSIKLPFFYFSALKSLDEVQEAIENEEEGKEALPYPEVKKPPIPSDPSSIPAASSETQSEPSPSEDEASPNLSTTPTIDPTSLFSSEVHSRLDLLSLLESLRPSGMSHITVGMVGYPNVGKSSIVNVLTAHTRYRARVGATPGKTKHFQTFNLSDTLSLCDCPGLVFPSFSSTPAELVCNGILPVDQLRDFITPSSLMFQRIPLDIIEKVYSLHLTPKQREQLLTMRAHGKQEGGRVSDEYTRAVLSIIGICKGYTAVKGGVDVPRTARVVLKDHVKGLLLWCTAPPGVKKDTAKESQASKEDESEYEYEYEEESSDKK